MAQQEAVTFYSWVEGMPSSLSVSVSGGERYKDGVTGKTMVNANKQIRFHKGILHTSDPEVIRVLRSKIARGASMTEDYETYLTHVLPVEDQLKRTASQLEAKRTELNRLKAEMEAQTQEIKARRGPGRPRKEPVPAEV